MLTAQAGPKHSVLQLIAMLVALAGVTLPAHAQGRYIGRTLPDILEAFRSQGVPVLYSTDLVLPDHIVTREPRGGGTERVLQQLLQPHGLRLQRSGTLLLVVPEPGPEKGDAPTAGSITGIVRDRHSRRAVPGAVVRLAEGSDSVNTGKVGDFWLTGVTAGSYTLIVEADGYERATVEGVEISAGRVRVHNVDILDPPGLEKLVVHASRYALHELVAGSYNALDRTDLDNLAPLGREPLRAVNRLPGAASGGLSARTNIRGGEADEVLVIFDGLQLYEPFHLKDFQSLFSTLDPRVVNALEIYTGGFPARYGDRLSGVIDVSTIGAAAERRGEIGADLFNVGVLASGMFANGRGEWLASARRGTLDLFIDIVNPDLGRPGYHDLLTSVRFDPGAQWSFSANAMLADDTISIREADNETRAAADYRSGHIWATATHSPSPWVSYTTLLAIIDADNRRLGFVDRPDEAVGQIDDRRSYRVLQLKQDWEFAPQQSIVARWGWDLRRIDGRYRYSSRMELLADDPLTTLGQPPERDVLALAMPGGGQFGAYVSGRWRVRPNWIGELGLRWDRQDYTLPGGDEQTSPRASLLYQPSSRTALRAGWGRFFQAQGVHELQIEDGVSRFFPAQRSEHIVLGLDHRFANELQLRLELYRKNMDRLRPRFENLFDPLELLPELETDRIRIAPDSAIARGVELMLSKQRADSPWSWWLNASRASVKDHIGGRKVPRSWDQQRSLSAGIHWRRGRWSLGTVGHYHSGWPTTVISVTPDPDDPDEFDVIIGPRNAARLAHYASIDVRAAWERSLRRGRTLTIFAQAGNLAGRSNPCCVNYSFEDDASGAEVVQKEFDYWLPMIPSIGFVWAF